jgi:DNA-binding transcriptional MerR regulator
VSYTAAQAARLSSCTVSQLRYWSRSGLLAPTDAGSKYSFRDLVALRVVRSLLDAGLSSIRVRAALRWVRESGDDLADLRLVTDGQHVWACRDDGQILDALRAGQLALFVAVDRLAAEVNAEVRAFDEERAAFVERLAGDVDEAGER